MGSAPREDGLLVPRSYSWNGNRVTEGVNFNPANLVPALRACRWGAMPSAWRGGSDGAQEQEDGGVVAGQSRTRRYEGIPDAE